MPEIHHETALNDSHLVSQLSMASYMLH